MARPCELTSVPASVMAFLPAFVVGSLVAGVLLAGCATALPEPTAEHAARAATRWPDSSREELLVGRRIYAKRCTGCHALHVPDTIAPERWRPIVAKMSLRARLGPAQAETLIRYLVTVSEPRGP